MKRALIIRHAAPETLGASFTAVLKHSGLELQELNIFELEPEYDIFPCLKLEDFRLIISLGGPMSANDRFPALQQEMDLYRAATDRGIPIFAVCLGAQLLTRALGGRVEPTGGYQFGLRRISITEQGDSDPVFGQLRVPLVPTLHGECFSVPDQAVLLAEGYIMLRNGNYRKINMAYRAGNSYAFQFEPQLTFEELQVWDREFSGDYLLMGPGFDPEEESGRNIREFRKFAPTHVAQMRDLLTAFLANAGLLESGDSPGDMTGDEAS